MGQSTSQPAPTDSGSATKRGPLAQKDSKIVIVGGAGTMGSSTALHLARRGFTDIRVLDVYQSPSMDSAGNDLSKVDIFRSVGLHGGAVDHAWEAWKTDPVFTPYCHNVGKLDLTTGDTPRARRLREKHDLLTSKGRTDLQWLSSGAEIKAVSPTLGSASIDSWRGLYTSDGGWVAARDALNSVGRELQKLGVKSAFGTSGTFKELLLREGRCVGVRAVDGTEWAADVVVLAAGAWSPCLVDLDGQCTSKAWGYAHIQLTPEEYEHFRGMPTMYNDQYGFFIEPRADSHLLKLCNEFPGYTHMQMHQPFGAHKPLRMSVPRSHASNPTDTVPTELIDDIKRLISTCIPQFEGRELINQGMCWCTDTDDASWLICEHPRFPGLVCATGDSGHTFKFLPIVGAEVADLMEGKSELSDERRHLWRWRPGAGDPNGTGRGGPPPKDLSEVDGWRHDPAKTSS